MTSAGLKDPARAVGEGRARVATRNVVRNAGRNVVRSAGKNVVRSVGRKAKKVPEGPERARNRPHPLPS